MLMNRHRPKPLSFEVKRVFRALVFTLILMLLGASLLFFINTNAASQKGYLLRQMEIQNEKFRIDNEALKQKVLEAQSFKNLSKEKSVKQMEQPNQFLFIPSRLERVSKK